MDKKFISYIKGKREIIMIAIALALGLILIFLGGRSRDDIDTEVEVSTEERIAAACSSVEGVGQCSVYVYYSPAASSRGEQNVESVIVVCDGADSATVRLRLTEMLSSFFGIGTNRVRIEKRKN